MPKFKTQKLIPILSISSISSYYIYKKFIHPESRPYSVGIIGGGISGLSITHAIQLKNLENKSNRPIQTLLFDPESPITASWGETRFYRYGYVDKVLLELMKFAHSKWNIFEEIARKKENEIINTNFQDRHCDTPETEKSGDRLLFKNWHPDIPNSLENDDSLENPHILKNSIETTPHNSSRFLLRQTGIVDLSTSFITMQNLAQIYLENNIDFILFTVKNGEISRIFSRETNNIEKSKEILSNIPQYLKFRGEPIYGVLQPDGGLLYASEILNFLRENCIEISKILQEEKFIDWRNIDFTYLMCDEGSVENPSIYIDLYTPSYQSPSNYLLNFNNLIQQLFRGENFRKSSFQNSYDNSSSNISQSLMFTELFYPFNSVPSTTNRLYENIFNYFSSIFNQTDRPQSSTPHEIIPSKVNRIVYNHPHFHIYSDDSPTDVPIAIVDDIVISAGPWSSLILNNIYINNNNRLCHKLPNIVPSLEQYLYLSPKNDLWGEANCPAFLLHDFSTISKENKDLKANKGLSIAPSSTLFYFAPAVINGTGLVKFGLHRQGEVFEKSNHLNQVRSKTIENSSLSDSPFTKDIYDDAINSNKFDHWAYRHMANVFYKIFNTNSIYQNFTCKDPWSPLAVSYGRCCYGNSDAIDKNFIIGRLPLYCGDDQNEDNNMSILVATAFNGEGFKFGPAVGDMIANEIHYRRIYGRNRHGGINCMYDGRFSPERNFYKN